MSHIEKSALKTCPHCGSIDLDTVACRSGPHHARVRCRGCGSRLNWAPAAMTPERAAAFRLWFGKHRGMTMAEIKATPGGPGYLQWLRDTEGMKANVRAAAALMMADRNG